MGKILLKSGATNYRVEDTISRCCLAHGYEVDPFVTPTVIILGNEDTDSFIYRVSRIGYRSTNLSLISDNEQPCLTIFCQVGYGLRRYLQMAGQKMAQPAPYGKWMVCLASGIGSAAFAAMLGGTAMTLLRPLLRAALPWVP